MPTPTGARPLPAQRRAPARFAADVDGVPRRSGRCRRRGGEQKGHRRKRADRPESTTPPVEQRCSSLHAMPSRAPTARGKRARWPGRGWQALPRAIATETRAQRQRPPAAKRGTSPPRSCRGSIDAPRRRNNTESKGGARRTPRVAPRRSPPCRKKRSGSKGKAEKSLPAKAALAARVPWQSRAHFPSATAKKRRTMAESS